MTDQRRSPARPTVRLRALLALLVGALALSAAPQRPPPIRSPGP
ncbi:hypothetical protein Q0F99_06330 [Rathayibacter oskolensis]|nr:hypothetical protein [Rathayibacter oskolensis]WKK72552.1 hypothetical protein Q0F99_06330 [Rathayibacter oskolensis]